MLGQCFWEAMFGGDISAGGFGGEFAGYVDDISKIFD